MERIPFNVTPKTAPAPRLRRWPLTPWRLVMIVCFWAVGIGIGMRAMWGYDTTPGRAAWPQNNWPVGISLSRDPGRFTLVMVVHPNCPCSRASLAELEAFISQCGKPVTAYVVFEQISGMNADPATTDLWKTATHISGVTAVSDTAGAMSRQFHAETSGQVFLYDPAGTLRFSGGITQARGHAGESDGGTALRSLVTCGKADRNVTPVFGCALH